MPRILVIEDAPLTRCMIAQPLQDQGHDVLQAKDGDEAVRLAVAEQPDVIVLDVILPRLNGYQVCRQIKSTREIENIPVIMLTSKTRNQDHQWGQEQGADEYLIKPVEDAILLAAIRRYLPQGKR